VSNGYERVSRPASAASRQVDQIIMVVILCVRRIRTKPPWAPSSSHGPCYCRNQSFTLACPMPLSSEPTCSADRLVKVLLPQVKDFSLARGFSDGSRYLIC